MEINSNLQKELLSRVKCDPIALDEIISKLNDYNKPIPDKFLYNLGNKKGVIFYSSKIKKLMKKESNGVVGQFRAILAQFKIKFVYMKKRKLELLYFRYRRPIVIKG